MNLISVIILMFLFHIIDDFYLQGTLANMKQKDWWDKYGPFYENDYLMALFIHSLSWSISINIPIMMYLDFQVGLFTVVSIICNLQIHLITDFGKANAKQLNLVQDQLIHFFQIIVTFGLFIYY